MTRRREDDPAEFDATPMRRDLPTWAKVTGFLGIPGFLLFYVLGVFTPLGLKSPILGNSQATAGPKIDALAGALREHHIATVESQRVYRLICRGVWKGNLEMQDNCEDRR